MAAIKIANDVYAVGVKNPTLEVFDVVMRTTHGTSYNAYLVDGGEKRALIETCHAQFGKEFFANVAEVCPLKNIDYIVLNHTEPDHSGILGQLIKRCPHARVVGTATALNFLKNIVNEEFPSQSVKDGDVLDLGGETLEFAPAPMLHWADSMFTYARRAKTLFSCDVFGQHYCFDGITDGEISDVGEFERQLEYYFNAVFGPFKPFVLKGLAATARFDFDVVCPSHGAVLTRGRKLGYALKEYARLAAPTAASGVPVFYCSAYGNTAQIAHAIAEGINSVSDGEAVCRDLVDADLSAEADLLNASKGFAVGTPTINAAAVPPVMQLLSLVDAVNVKKRPALVFGSYGWSGEGVPIVVSALTALKVKTFGDGFKVCFVPTQSDLEAARELGAEFAKSIK